MADNINIDAGSTLTVATDDISGVHYQVIKVAHGALNTANLASDTTPFPVTIASATLGTVTISGTVTPSTTASTITNAASNPVPVTGNINVATATLGTVTITGTVTPSSTAATITNAVGNPVNVSLTLTEVTVKSAVAGFNVNVATATLGTVTISGSVTNSVSTIPIMSKTITGSSGTISTSGNNTIFAAGTNRTKVFAFSLTTTATTPTLCIFQSGAGGNELWRVLLQAPSGANSGANLVVSPPSYIFATAAATLLNLNLSAANAVHYSFSCYDEA